MPEFTIEEIIRATGGKPLTTVDQKKTGGVSIDSRTLVPGDVFFALKGENFDGHNYCRAAIDKGAVAVVIEREIELPSAWPGAVILVPDTLKAFGHLARYHRLRFNNLPVIGITGSNGKTTTKELIAAILAEKHQVVKTEKNFNNEIGLPLTLFKIDSTTEAVVVEMGMRGRGQIGYLADLARPTIGVVTNVGLTHLELLGTQAAIAQAKAELIQALPPSGLAVLNGDDPFVAKMAGAFPGKSLFFSLEKNCSYTQEAPAIFAVATMTEGESEKVITDGSWGKFGFTLPLLGHHNIANALAAAIVGLVLGATPAEVAWGLRRVDMVEKRLRKLEVDGIIVLDDTYNASPASVTAALEVLHKLKNNGRKIAVLGDMLELGEISREAHQNIGELAADYGCAALFTYGPLSLATKEGAANKGIFARHYTTKGDLWADLKTYLKPGDAVLIKGSRGMEMETVVEMIIAENREG